MSQAVTLNSVGYTIPDVGENDWGQNVTDFLVAIPGAVLQKSGGSFTLTAEVDFGATYGLKSAYYKSRAANPASAGAVRLGVADVVSWRNNANGANLDLGVDAADALIYGSNKVITVAGGFTSVATNSYANQKGIRFMEQTANGVNYVEVVAPDAVTANVTLKLPDGVGSAGQVLSTDGAGVLSWINAAGGGTVNSGTQGRLAVYSATGTTIDDTVTMTNVVSVAIAAHGQTTALTIPDGGQATANFVLSEGTATINGAKTLTGATVISNNSTAAFTISQASTLKVDSTNALVSIGTTTMTYPLYVSKSSAGATVSVVVENSEAANAASHARLYVVTGGASGGDPYINLYNGVQNYSIGLDNSDSDALCVTGAATLNGTNLLRLTTAGALTVASTLTVTAGGATISAGALTIAATSNQIVLGTTNTTTISATAPSASRVYTMPDAGGAASFVMTLSDQSINGKITIAKDSSTQTLEIENPNSRGPLMAFTKSAAVIGYVGCSGSIEADTSVDMAFYATGAIRLYTNDSATEKVTLPAGGGITVNSDPAGTPAANTLYKANIVKGWINLDGTGTVAINDSFNVSGIVDNGVGDYTVTWDTDFANANYCCQVSCFYPGYPTINNSGALATGSARVFIQNVAGSGVDVDVVCVMAVGDQ